MEKNGSHWHTCPTCFKDWFCERDDCLAANEAESQRGRTCEECKAAVEITERGYNVLIALLNDRPWTIAEAVSVVKYHRRKEQDGEMIFDRRMRIAGRKEAQEDRVHHIRSTASRLINRYPHAPLTAARCAQEEATEAAKPFWNQVAEEIKERLKGE
jgi:hypothetical protein